MIIEQMTLRVKNIIFFKSVCLCLIFTFLSYLLNSLSVDLSNSYTKNNKAYKTKHEAEIRLKALLADPNKLQHVVKKYEELQENIDAQFTVQCFDKPTFINEVHRIEKKHGLKDQASIFVSSNFANKKNQPKHSVILKSTTIGVDYYINNFLTAIKFAEEVYKVLPNYSLIRKFEIVKHNSITPSLAEWIKTANEVEVISSHLTMEVREIGLNNDNE